MYLKNYSHILSKNYSITFYFIIISVQKHSKACLPYFGMPQKSIPPCFIFSWFWAAYKQPIELKKEKMMRQQNTLLLQILCWSPSANFGFIQHDKVPASDSTFIMFSLPLLGAVQKCKKSCSTKLKAQELSVYCANFYQVVFGHSFKKYFTRFFGYSYNYDCSFTGTVMGLKIQF